MKKQINAMFKSGRLTKNYFQDTDVAINEIDGLGGVMDSGLADDFSTFLPITKVMHDSGPMPGFVSIQRHSVSVEEHTDDVASGVYFQCAFLWSRRVIDTAYDNRPEFLYFDARGSKHKDRINDGDCVIFNPRKPHSLIFYGDECTLALRSVVRQ